ncbi:MAG: hypothetical protein OEV06_06010, partial [Anaerolineae bacterium]|nr:hypothetical protein [Anaerolineae bacterium]
MISKPFARTAYILLAAAIFLACGLGTPTATPAPPPPATPPPTQAPPEPPVLGSISGVLWHELCRFVDGSPPVLGEGCVQWGAESWEFGPNQVYDEFESGWA